MAFSPFWHECDCLVGYLGLPFLFLLIILLRMEPAQFLSHKESGSLSACLEQRPALCISGALKMLVT